MWTGFCGKCLLTFGCIIFFRDFSCYKVAYLRNICELTDISGLQNLRELSLKPVASLPARIEQFCMTS